LDISDKLPAAHKIPSNESISSDPIFLVGFMGCGKTRVGKLLAQSLDREHLDMDTILEQRMQKTISQCFDQDGEAHFRQLEAQLLQELKSHKSAVISTGGGIVLDPQNRAELKKHLTIWLYRDLEHLSIRKSETRPLLKNANPQRIRQLFEARKPLYAEVCSFMVHNQDIPKSSDLIYEEIRHLL
jgi:shikimate kinase